MKHVDIYTDGACKGNPGAGGWGAILKYGTAHKTLSGHARDTTNNRMELTAVLQALYALREPCEVTIYTDSQYVVNGINKGWAERWRSNGWINSRRQNVLNSDLWKSLLNAIRAHVVTFVWIRGHNGHPENELCDTIAVNESRIALEE